MFSFLKKFLPPANEEFFALFDEAADNCRKTAQILLRISEEGVSDAALEEAKQLKQESKVIARTALHKLNTSFITPIDREDIQILANLLRKITKKIVRSCSHMQLFKVDSTTPNIKSQAATLKEATDELINVIRLLRRISMVEEATTLNTRMKEIESRGDEILNQTFAMLYTQGLPPLDVMKYSEIHKSIESALNYCYDVSDAVLSAVLKHS